MESSKNIVIMFTDESDRILSEIMAKYNLQEPLEKAVENSRAGKLNNIVKLDKITTSFAKGELAEKTLISSIQEQIGVSSQTAGNVARDIINNLVPTLKKATEADIKKMNEEAAAELKEKEEKNPAQKPITAQPVRLIDETKTPVRAETPPQKIVPKIENPKPAQTQVKKPLPQKTVLKTEPKPEAKPKKTDSYRESLD